jgi:hypothetical protein
VKPQGRDLQIMVIEQLPQLAERGLGEVFRADLAPGVDFNSRGPQLPSHVQGFLERQPETGQLDSDLHLAHTTPFVTSIGMPVSVRHMAGMPADGR